jgi:adenylate cyclase
VTETAPDGTARPSGRILVVDDSRVNRLMLSRLLSSLGHEAVEVDNGRLALERLRAADAPPIDVVLLDLVMPELDGYATLAAMKADPALAEVPVVVISDVDDLASVVRCIEMGAADYLPRPYEPSILGARIGTSLENGRLVRTISRQRAALARFLSPQVADLVASPRGEELLVGHRRKISAVFCDLRGFTAFTETAEPEELLGVLREYHAAMGGLVVEYGGTLEHFAGDGMLVFFNDPLPQDDHEVRAVRMALAMRDRFNELAVRWRKRGYDLGFGVGIAAGFATLGRIGFEGRHDYAAIGTVVILASRLSARALDGQILLSQAAHAAVEGSFELESAGELELKGFSRPIPAFLALGVLGAGAPPPMADATGRITG